AVPAADRSTSIPDRTTQTLLSAYPHTADSAAADLQKRRAHNSKAHPKSSSTTCRSHPSRTHTEQSHPSGAGRTTHKPALAPCATYELKTPTSSPAAPQHCARHSPSALRRPA